MNIAIYFVGGDVLDAPFARKCCFITISDSRGRLSLQIKNVIDFVGEGFSLPPYKKRADATFALQTCYVAQAKLNPPLQTNNKISL